MIAFTSGLTSLLRTVPRTAVLRRSSHFRVRMSASQENDPVQWGAIAVSAVATPVTAWSEYTLATTGSGLPDQYGLIEGLSYLAIVGLVGWSIFTKVRTREYTVVKRDHLGAEVLSYDGQRIDLVKDKRVTVRAVFKPKSVQLTEKVGIFRGDTLTEYFYGDRWYNVFRIESTPDRTLRGWYCNITRPAIISEDRVESDDLALDLVVAPDGECTVLDQNQFEMLSLPDDEVSSALSALAELETLVDSRTEFFSDIPPR